jgi:cell division protein FtsQ
MHQQINKKIFFYLFVFILLGTLNNKNLAKLEFPKVNKIEVSGLDKENDIDILKNLDFLKVKNILFLDHFKIEEVIDSNRLIESYSVFKIYPSSIEIRAKKTIFLANVSKDGKYFLFGSNGKLINTIEQNKELPFIFGNFNSSEFFNLKLIIDKSNFSFFNIKNLFFFPSGRWDIETNSGILIKLPKNNLKEAFDLSLDMLDNVNDKNIKMIDVRMQKQVVINE